MVKLVDYYSDVTYYSSVWKIESESLKSDEACVLTYSVTFCDGMCFVHLCESKSKSSSLIARFEKDFFLDREVVISVNNRDGQILRNEFSGDAYLSCLTGVSLCFSAFIPGVILAGDSAYHRFNAEFIQDQALFDEAECDEDFRLLLGEKGEIRGAKYLLGDGRVRVRNINEFKI